MQPVFRPYQPRPIRFAGVRDVAGWRMKCYEIDGRKEEVGMAHPTTARGTAHPAPDGLDWDQYAAALAHAESILPLPPKSSERAGIGFLIAHEIATHHYLIVCWWDNQNELFARCFVRPVTDAVAWDFSGAAFSFRVWDMVVMWFERQAWIECALAGREVRVDEYLGRTMA